MQYLIKSGDLVYKKNMRARPYFVYIILLILNKIPLSRAPSFSDFLANFFKTLRLKVTFAILDKKIQFYIHTGVSDFKYHGGMPHEPRISEIFLRLAPPRSVFYDIGSSIGWYSVLITDKCKEIFAFDPFDNSSLINAALNRVANFKFYNYFLSNHKALNKFETTTIDDLIRENNFPAPDIIKMDIEGEEYKVLLGAKQLFEKTPPKIILVETHSEELFYECLKFLKSFDYQIYNLGCPKINVGGDIYSLSYNLDAGAYDTKSATRTILALKKQ